MRQTMRIGEFDDSFLPVMDGVNICVKNYAEHLTRLGMHCTVVTADFPGYVDDEPYPVLRYSSFPLYVKPPYRFGFPKLDLDFRLKLRRHKFDLVHAHSPFFAGQLGFDVARWRKIPVVATFHTKYRDDFQARIPVKPIVDIQVRNIVRFYESVDEVWVPNRATGGTLREYGYTGDMIVVENGCDMKPDENITFHRNRGNTLLGFGDTETVLLYVGQIILEKNLEFLLKAVSILAKSGRNFKMVLVGDGYARKQLEKYADAEGLGQSVQFAGLVKDRELLKAYYARADLFLFPSVYDNAPLVVKEVSAFSVPSVFIRGTNAAENVIHGRNGYMTDPEPAAYARQVGDLLDYPESRIGAGRQARATLYRSWENVVAEAAGRYREIIERFGVEGVSGRIAPEGFGKENY